jgi:hypothetical protein
MAKIGKLYNDGDVNTARLRPDGCDPDIPMRLWFKSKE